MHVPKIKRTKTLKKEVEFIGSAIILAILLFSSCTQEKDTFFPETIADATYKLEGEKYLYDTLKSPYRLFLINDRLFVTQDNKVNFDEPMIHIFNNKTIKRVGAIGKNGLGPNEMLFASHLDIDLSDSTVIVFDGMNKRLSKFKLSLLNKDYLNAQSQTILPSNMTEAFKTYRASDTSYLSIATQKEFIFNEYSFDGNWIKGYSPWPKSSNEKQLAGFSRAERNFLLSSINSGWYKKQIGGNWYGLAMNYRNRIELFNYETKEIKTIKGPDLNDEIQPFKIAGSGAGLGGAYGWDAKYTYRDLVFKDRNIYALFGGHSQLDYQETGIVAKTVFIFSYDLQLKARLILDRSVIALEVDEDEGKIYTITTDENPGIAVFNLPLDLLSNKKP